MKDGTDKTERYQFDKNSQLVEREVEVVDPVNGNSTTPLKWTYQYYLNGFTAGMIEPSGKSTHYGYDSKGNLTGETVYRTPKVNTGATSNLPINVDLNVSSGQTVAETGTLTVTGTSTDEYGGGLAWTVKGATVHSSSHSQVVVKGFSDQALLEVTGTSRTDGGTYDRLVVKLTYAYTTNNVKYYTVTIESETPVVSGEKLTSGMNPALLSDWQTRTRTTFNRDNLPVTSTIAGYNDTTYGYSAQLSQYTHDHYTQENTPYHLKSQTVIQCLTSNPEAASPSCDASEASATPQYTKSTFDPEGRLISQEVGAGGPVAQVKTQTQFTYFNPGVTWKQMYTSEQGVEGTAQSATGTIRQYQDQVWYVKDGNATTRYQYDALGQVVYALKAGPDGLSDRRYLVAGINASNKDNPTYHQMLTYSLFNGFGQPTYSRVIQLDGSTVVIPVLQRSVQVYGASGELLSSWEGQKENTTQYTYTNNFGPSFGQVIQVKWGEGDGSTVTTTRKTTDYLYDPYGRIQQQTVDGFITQYGYNSLDQLVSEKWFLDPNSTSGTFGEKKTRYHITGQPDQVTEVVNGERPVGGSVSDTVVTRMEVNKLGQVTQVTAPDGGVVLSTYDGRGQVVRTIDRRLTMNSGDDDAQSTYFKYDSTGKLLRVLKPILRKNAGSAYQDLRRPYVQYSYDAFGRKVTEQEYIGNRTAPVSSAEFYSGSFVFSSVAEDFKTTQYEYNNQDQVTRVTNPRGYATTMEYDPAGNDWKTEQEVYKGDDAGANYAYPSQKWRTIYQSFDALGRVYQTFDGLGYERRKTYNMLGSVTAEIEPAPTAAGTLMVRKVFTYTRSGLLESILEPSVAEGAQLPVIPANMATSLWESNETSVPHLIKTEYRRYGNRAYPDIISKAYLDNAAGTSNAVSTTYTYGRDGQLLTEAVNASGSVPSTALTSSFYDSRGLLIYRKHWDNYVEINSYDRMGQKTRDGSVFPAFDLQYDLMGNETQRTVKREQFTNLPQPNVPASLETITQTTKFQYNSLDLPIRMEGGPGESHWYGYRSDGMKTYETNGVFNGSLNSSYSWSSLTAGMTAGSVKYLTLDSLGQVIQERLDSEYTRQYFYDGLGRRIREIFNTVTPNDTSVYITSNQTKDFLFDLNGNLIKINDIDYSFYPSNHLWDEETDPTHTHATYNYRGLDTTKHSYYQDGKIKTSGTKIHEYDRLGRSTRDGNVKISYTSNSLYNVREFTLYLPESTEKEKTIVEFYDFNRQLSRKDTDSNRIYDNSAANTYNYTNERYDHNIIFSDSCYGDYDHCNPAPCADTKFCALDQYASHSYRTILSIKESATSTVTYSYHHKGAEPPKLESINRDTLDDEGNIVKTEYTDKEVNYYNDYDKSFQRTYRLTPSGKRIGMSLAGYTHEFSYDYRETQNYSGIYSSLCSTARSIVFSKKYNPDGVVSKVIYQYSNTREEPNGNDYCSVDGAYDFSYDYFGNQTEGIFQTTKTYRNNDDGVVSSGTLTAIDRHQNTYLHGELIQSVTEKLLGKTPEANSKWMPGPERTSIVTRDLSWSGLETSLVQNLISPFQITSTPTEFQAPTPSSSVGLGASSVDAPEGFGNPFGVSTVLPPSDVQVTQNNTGVTGFSNPLPTPDQLQNNTETQTEPLDPSEFGPPVPLTDANPNGMGASGVSDSNDLTTSTHLGVGQATLPVPELNPNLSGNTGSTGVVAPDSELNPNIGGTNGNTGGYSGTGSGVISPEHLGVEMLTPVTSFSSTSVSQATSCGDQGTASNLESKVALEKENIKKELGEKEVCGYIESSVYHEIDKWFFWDSGDKIVLKQKILFIDEYLKSMGRSPQERLDFFKGLQMGMASRDREGMRQGVNDAYRLALKGSVAYSQGRPEEAQTLGRAMTESMRAATEAADANTAYGMALADAGLTMLGAVNGYAAARGLVGLIGKYGFKGALTTLKTTVKTNWSAFLRETGENCFRRASLHSFDGNTPVWTKYGLAAIATLTIGTPVLAFNEKTREQGYYPITQVFENHDPQITGLVIENPETKALEYLTTTPEHPFYVTERSDGEPRPKPEGHPDLSDKWVGAGHLKVGDKLKQADGTLGEVRYVNTIQEARTMYNLEVEEAHTFFVGTQGWLVHNCIAQSRINLAKGPTRFTPIRNSGNPISAGWDHVVSGHFNRPVSNSRSVFTITEDELKAVLTSKQVVQSPITADATVAGQFIREVDVGFNIGLTTLKDGGVATSRMRIFTDSKGNLITAFPIK
ncbi:polymorphic toxin-type HINT domain-containing protein [Deinococcus cellulosilyticus]|uniref:Hint domain-containing protein n=1 Tax=Deinococcus cellulosilyticus (strain DSM 18568 / NBRC 106333 / KACC 11606 / 5516J-15) TaxID=1223518 RepID=A0A511NAY4_DEIC1|nr:polymorphic toxin-type HINT domain-containing protein [Deinococcus cellulosilyticus]GEM49980.1 hypothetical protein DC3_56150 [Deinococcus cellulosilyticus NBRC 106333 = KACC 11606]